MTDHMPIGTSSEGKPAVGSGNDRAALRISAGAAGGHHLPVPASGRPCTRRTRATANS